MTERNAEHLKIALDLLKDSAQQAQTWTTRFIAVNGALLTAVGLIVGWSQFDKYKMMLMIVVGAICAFGAIVSWLLAGITLRQINWNRAIRKKIRAIQQIDVLPADDEPEAGGVSHHDFTAVMMWFTPIAWIALGLVVVIGLATAT